MTDSLLKYYCDESLKGNDHDKWNQLLDYAFSHGDQVEFNILDSSAEPSELLESVSDDFIERGKRKDKIYPSGQFIRYHLSDRIKTFIRSKRYSDWNNYFFEDISFLKDGKEFFATITHENYVILQMTEDQRETLNNNGFAFQFNWGIDPSEKTKNTQKLIKFIPEKIDELLKKSK